MNEAQLVRAITEYIAKGDQAIDKAQQYYTSAGQHLKTLKQNHTASWSEWEQVLKEKCQLSTGRASELMQIADGRKTVAEIRKGKAHSMKKIRARSSSPRGEEPGAPIAIHPANLNSPTSPAADIAEQQPEVIEAKAEPDISDDTYVGRDPEWDALSELSGLQRAWDATSTEAKQQFVTTNIIELTALVAHHRKQQASAAADRAIERTAPPPLRPVAYDFPDMPAFLDRTAKPN